MSAKDTKTHAKVLRHTAASNVLVASRDAVTTAAILGHTDVSMLSRVYGHLDKHPEHLKRLLDETNGERGELLA